MAFQSSTYIVAHVVSGVGPVPSVGSVGYESHVSRALHPSSSVEVTRRVAKEIWRGDRTRFELDLGGLNSEDEVRRRLRYMATGLSGFQYTRFDREPALSILGTTERLISESLPGPFESWSDVQLAGTSRTRQLTNMLITQCLAGRLGFWATRNEEVRDARVARGLYRQSRSQQGELVMMLIAGDELFKRGRFLQAAVCFLDADRIDRSAIALLKTSLCLWKSHQLEAALWAARACLLEPLDAFPDATLLFRAHKVEASLARLSQTHESTRPQPAYARVLSHLDSDRATFAALSELPTQRVEFQSAVA